MFCGSNDSRAFNWTSRANGGLSTRHRLQDQPHGLQDMSLALGEVGGGGCVLCVSAVCMLVCVCPRGCVYASVGGCAGVRVCVRARACVRPAANASATASNRF